jgi:hypothetical protein
MRMLPWLLAGLVVIGCAASTSHTPSAGQVDPSPPLGTRVLVRQVLEGAAEARPVFLPAELLDSGLEGWSQHVPHEMGYTVWFVEQEEASPSTVEPATARRPPRGNGPLVRRPPGPRLRATPPPWRSEMYRLPPERLAHAVQQAQQQYYRKLAEAQARYPKHQGYHHHHAVPMYLGGPKEGMTYRIPAAYHEAITQAFRQRWPYGREEPPRPQELLRILAEVYSEYPIPQLIGIMP